MKIIFRSSYKKNDIIQNQKTDYKITSDFAKKLSITGNTERHEQARQYFIACKQSSINTDKLSNAIENTDIAI